MAQHDEADPFAGLPPPGTPPELLPKTLPLIGSGEAPAPVDAIAPTPIEPPPAQLELPPPDAPPPIEPPKLQPLERDPLSGRLYDMVWPEPFIDWRDVLFFGLWGVLIFGAMITWSRALMPPPPVNLDPEGFMRRRGYAALATVAVALSGVAAYLLRERPAQTGGALLAGVLGFLYFWPKTITPMIEAQYRRDTNLILALIAVFGLALIARALWPS